MFVAIKLGVANVCVAHGSLALFPVAIKVDWRCISFVMCYNYRKKFVCWKSTYLTWNLFLSKSIPIPLLLNSQQVIGKHVQWFIQLLPFLVDDKIHSRGRAKANLHNSQPSALICSIKLYQGKEEKNWNHFFDRLTLVRLLQFSKRVHIGSNKKIKKRPARAFLLDLISWRMLSKRVRECPHSIFNLQLYMYLMQYNAKRVYNFMKDT